LRTPLCVRSPQHAPPLLTTPSCKPVLAEDGAPAPLFGTVFEGYESGVNLEPVRPSTWRNRGPVVRLLPGRVEARRPADGLHRCPALAGKTVSWEPAHSSLPGVPARAHGFGRAGPPREAAGRARAARGLRARTLPACPAREWSGRS